jgi:hypothetical protein
MRIQRLLQRLTLNIQRSISQPIHNPKSAIQNRRARGRIELPTNPECSRGCSTAANGKLRVVDSFSPSSFSRYSGLLLKLRLLYLRRLPDDRRSVSSCGYDRADVERVFPVNQEPTQYSAFPTTLSECKPVPFFRSCQGGESNSRPRAYESPALPLSYPGVAAKRFNGASRHVNGT